MAEIFARVPTLDLLAHARRALACADTIAYEPPDVQAAHAIADLRHLAEHLIASVDDPSAHPLEVARKVRGWSYETVARKVAIAAAEMGQRGMAAERQKVWRWVHRGVVPEVLAQYALARVFGVNPAEVDQRPWPAWLTPEAPLVAGESTPAAPDPQVCVDCCEPIEPGEAWTDLGDDTWKIGPVHEECPG